MQSSWRRVLDRRSAPRSVDSVPELAPGLLGGRYQVLNRIGSGGMGVVYRALDRLTGGVVTLKQLHPDLAPHGSGSSDGRLELAREFTLLASLRHPNIISVLDYGFDPSGRPFFTMDLEEHAVTIIDAARGRPLLVQVDLLVQTLRALAYLHRHDIVHRDLKPANVLVVRGVVKVLDFGLSSHLEGLEGRGDWVGTFPYMAPEVLRGEATTSRTDLYGFGMIAYEMLTGEYPFDTRTPLALHRHILETALPLPDADVDERIRPVLTRLLAKQPAERPASASEVVHALGKALGQALAVETIATRESFLQAAPLVGRRAELATLLTALDDARNGSGGAWLVGGDSGVGKSRLLDEMRTRALVRGMTVLCGQAQSRGGAPYHVWRDVVSAAVLRVALSDDDVAVLRAIVPDIGRLLGREVHDAPAVAPEAAQSRLALAVEELLRAQPGPVLVILEDLHWVGSESLRLLSWLAQAAPAVRLVLLGSYRDDEAPLLPKAVEAASLLRLERLPPAEIEALAVAMIGEAARRPDLLALLVQETEGIPFFLVEITRTLAESGRGLEGLADQALPARVLSGGVQRMIRRRLTRVPEPALGPLRTAAVAGRVVDAALLSRIHPELDVAAWAAECTAAGVLEPRDQAWRFAHDKLREQLLVDTSPAVRRGVHRRIAEALEAKSQAGGDDVTALAYHWGEAGEPDREAEYAFRAGMLALESGACQEAVGHLTRTLEVLEQRPAASDRPVARHASRIALDPNARVDPDAPRFRQAVVEGGLTDAYFGLGELRRSREHGARALSLFGHSVPDGPTATVFAILRQCTLRVAQVTVGVRSRDPERAARTTAPVARVLMRLIDTYFYSVEAAPLAWSILRMMTECAPRGPSPEVARAYILGALLAGMSSVKRLGQAWCREAVRIADACGSDADRAWIQARVAVFRLAFGEWQAADAAATRACILAREVGDLRSYQEDRLMSGLLDSIRGRYEAALDHYQDAREATRRSGDRQMGWDAGVVTASLLVRLGRHEEAAAACREALAQFATMDQLSMRSEHCIALGTHALAALRSGDRDAAWDSAARAAALLAESTPVAYWVLESIARTSEALFGLLEANAQSAADERVLKRAADVTRVAQQYARLFPIGRPQAHLSRGSLAWMRGRHRRAQRSWRRALAAATRLQMPYEMARAHTEIGSHLALDAPMRRAHLAQAAAIFGQLGCAWDLAVVVALRDCALPAIAARTNGS